MNGPAATPPSPPPHAPPHPPPSRTLGLVCPGCGGGRLPVWYTRPKPGLVLRVRRCRDCGKRVTTRERCQGGG